jgi:hypothetical protein
MIPDVSLRLLCLILRHVLGLLLLMGRESSTKDVELLFEVADVALRVELAEAASRGELGFHLRDEVPLRPGVAREVQWRFRHEGLIIHSP